MALKIKAKDLARLCGQLRHLRSTDIRAEHRKGGHTRTLVDVRPDITPQGRPTIRTIHVIEDGHQQFFDGNYELEVTALLIAGKRHSL
jgi:hypothetical protein